jgi:outer membrane protein OmpA-like peptidoglycan-associated protein
VRALWKFIFNLKQQPERRVIVMKARQLAGPMSAAILAACFPGYTSKVETGSPKTDFVKGEKREGKPRIEVSSSGNALTARAVSEITCYGSNVTTTPQQRVYERKGVDPFIGIGIGVVSAAVFGVAFASGICDPNDPRLFDFNKEEPGGGIATSQVACDLTTAGGTLFGFSGALAYGATSIRVLTREPKTEELTPEQKSEAATQACGVEPLANEPIAVVLTNDKVVSYAWTDSEGNAKFDLNNLIDPSVQGGMSVSFARDVKTVMASVTEEQLASNRPVGWSPLVKTPSTGEASITRAHYEIGDVGTDIRRLTLSVKVKNATKDVSTLTPQPVFVRAKLASKDSAGVNGRTIIWDNLAISAEEEKTITIDLPKELPDPGSFDVFLINKEGIVLTKVTAKTGPEEPVKLPDPPKPSADTKAVVDKATGQILIYEQVKFANGKAVIDASSNGLLNVIAKLLNENPDVKMVRIEGHSDDKGKAATNDKLSADRAAAVVKYLTITGKVDATRLVAKGYGSSCAMVANDSDENRAKNRRVEFVILGEKDDPKGICRVQSKK